MSYRVAVIEDDPLLGANYADAFRDQGYQVELYTSRSDAIDVFQSRLPDLAIIDIGLGDEVDGGFALCQCCLLYTSPSPRDVEESRMPSSA